MKLLLWGVVLFIAVMWYLNAKKTRLREQQRSQDAAPPGKAAPASALESEKMLRCAQCGVYIPSSEAIAGPDSALAFCSSEHRAQHGRRA